MSETKLIKILKENDVRISSKGNIRLFYFFEDVADYTPKIKST